MRILSVANVKVDKRLGYGYLEEIVVRRADRKPYTFKEGDFKNLHLNDIKDMLILHVHNRLFNLEGKDIVDLAVALRMYDIKRSKVRIGIMLTKTELALEQTQQCVSDEVLVSIEGVEE
ncbi:hypothetical protein Tco_1115857 [Tanacetum coccineum]